ncbi:hypothetical protein [Thaumasiovibrio subtropicus]|uniref:hypothetical protein n=1 Tax=Thaumasiovibrio subtropicus TaxID=1891207 RepID=UPI000B3539E9|nr:hypothetical protein [Thaumasiovibrio subtropicus]
MKKSVISLFVCSALAAPAAFSSPISNPEIGVVLDGYYQSGERQLSEREEGFGLGHTEINMSANIDDKFRGSLTTVLESHGDHADLLIEEAFIETTSLPHGLNIKGGRFLSSFGSLNNQHLHEDAFAERPVAYRNYLGGHFYDDGVSASVVLPTDLYIRLGVEALSGQQMSAIDDPSTVGIYSATATFGGDISTASSWQLGFSYLRNDNGRVDSFGDHDHDHDHDHPHRFGHDHDHSHSASVTGKHLYGMDFVWKWAPNGNYKYQNLTVSAEWLRLNDATSRDYKFEHDYPGTLDAFYLSGVYRLSPSWSVGARYSEAEDFDVKMYGHYPYFKRETEREFDLMLAWNSSHFGTIRGQYTRAENQRHDREDNIFTLQYVMSFGAHGAHAF